MLINIYAHMCAHTETYMYTPFSKKRLGYAAVTNDPKI